MYCPGCGSPNQDDLKFCTHCGTNLGLVSAALSGRAGGPSELDERMVRLLKDFYRGRNSAAIGGMLTGLCLFKLILIMFVWGGAEKLIPFGILGSIGLLAGLVALAWGLWKWTNATSEIKAIEEASRGNFFGLVSRRTNELAEPAQEHIASDRANDRIKLQPTVTEHTTRQLERSADRPAASKEI